MEIPTTISGLIIGILVTAIVEPFMYLFCILLIPYAAIVPITVAAKDEIIARISVFLRALSVAESLKSSPYHLREKPVNSLVLFDALKEYRISTAIGIYRKMNMRMV